MSVSARALRRPHALIWQRANAFEALALSHATARNSLKEEVRALTSEFDNGLRPYQDVLQAEASVQDVILQEIEARYQSVEQSLLLASMIQALVDLR